MTKDPVTLPNAMALAPARRLMWWGIAAITLIAGYADLWRGGETIAPILLVVAYCVLVPIAILKR
jgi:hypothetical protein